MLSLIREEEVKREGISVLIREEEVKREGISVLIDLRPVDTRRLGSACVK